MSSAVTAAGFKSISKNGGEFALLDIRKPEDFQAGHLLLSVNIPVASYRTPYASLSLAWARRSCCMMVKRVRLVRQ